MKRKKNEEKNKKLGEKTLNYVGNWMYVHNIRVNSYGNGGSEIWFFFKILDRFHFSGLIKILDRFHPILLKSNNNINKHLFRFTIEMFG